jgi:DNA-binding transcriptional LysR family regulator
MSLTLRQLQIIRAVNRWGSMTQAAEALGISQPAVSMMLRESTDIAGFPLFLRKQGRLQPSGETRELIADLERIFEGVDRVNRLVEDMRDMKVGSVHIAATPTLADNLVPAAVALFRKSHPHVRITIHTMDNLSVAEHVAEEHVDFGLALSPAASDGDLKIDLVTADLICLVHRDNPLAMRESVTPGDLAGMPLISFSRSLPLGQLVERAFQRAKVPQKITLEVNQSSLAYALVRVDAGVAIVDPFWMFDASDDRVVRLKLLPQIRVSAQALLPTRGTLPRSARRFLASLRAVAESLPSTR